MCLQYRNYRPIQGLLRSLTRSTREQSTTCNTRRVFGLKLKISSYPSHQTETNVVSRKKIICHLVNTPRQKIVMSMSPKNSIARQDLKFLSFLGLSTGRKSGHECVILQIVKLRNHSNAGKGKAMQRIW